ncbi:MAG: DinB family protein [Chitinophagaceae bacterium]
MTQLSSFLTELERESVATKKMLAAVPNDRYDWTPHPKSMTIRALITHIAELPCWIGMVLHTNELDFATMDYKPTGITDTDQLVKEFEKNYEAARVELANGDESTLGEPWTLRNGERVYSIDPKSEVIRMSLSQTIHHRAQLGVFLRLLDVPIPGSYGPSADESF